MADAPAHARRKALARLMGATVRLEGGTGVLVTNRAATVVVTADHVVAPDGKVEGPVRVWSENGWTDCPVLAREPKPVDLAVLSAPLAFDGRGLDLVEDPELLPGEDLWTCGFPLGWKSKDSPVLCRGIVAAGVDSDHWANLEASWGNSGGALVVVAGDDVLLGGIALGRAGAAHDELDGFRRKLEISIDQHFQNDAALERSAEGVAKTQRSVQRSRAEFEKVLAGGSLPGPDAERVRAKLETLELEAALGRVEFQSLEMFQRIHKMLPGLTAMVADFIDDHFRTGFIRYAPASAVRKVLGLG